jgi:hypothetical protein
MDGAMRKFISAALLWLVFSGVALAQSGIGQIPSLNVVGNPTGSTAAPTAFPLFSTPNVWSALQTLKSGFDVSNGCTVTAGAYDSDGTLSWVPTCSGVFTASTPSIPHLSTTGTTPINGSSANGPWIAVAPLDQQLIQTIAASEYLPENALGVNMDVTVGATTETGTVSTSGTAVTKTAGPPFVDALISITINSVSYNVASVTSQTTLTLQSTAGTQTGVAASWSGQGSNNQKVGFYNTIHMHPGSSGSLPTSTWATNPDLVVGSGSGPALAINGEHDYTNFDEICNVGGACFRVMDWHNYLSAYPIVASLYGSATTNNYTGIANTSGTAVTWVSGVQFSTDTTTITVNGVTYYHVTYNSPTSLTLPASAGTHSGVTFSWDAHAINDFILLTGDNLVSQNDVYSATSAYNLINAAGHHNVVLNAAADAAPYAVLAAQNQNVCFNGFDACLGYVGSNVTQFVQNGQIVVQLEGAPGATDYLVMSNGNGGSAISTSGGFLLMSSGGGLTSMTDTDISMANLPASAGSGGVNVCVDNTGRLYKKSSCP